MVPIESITRVRSIYASGVPRFMVKSSAWSDEVYVFLMGVDMTATYQQKDEWRIFKDTTLRERVEATRKRRGYVRGAAISAGIDPALEAQLAARAYALRRIREAEEEQRQVVADTVLAHPTAKERLETLEVEITALKAAL